MLTLNQLKPAIGAKRDPKRIGRGPGSGRGCTAGKGNNGDKARSGARYKLYFEGGQTPTTRRVPKRGFTNIFRKEYQIVNLGDINKLDINEKEIGIEFLYENGLIHNLEEPVKILGDGEFTKSITIKAHAFSESAKEKIEKANGKAEIIKKTNKLISRRK